MTNQFRRRLVPFFTLAFASAASARLEWSRRHMMSESLFGVAARTSFVLTTIAVGELGVIMRTTDRGSGWSLQESGTRVALTAVSFAGSNVVVVGEEGTILRSTDVGITWTPQDSRTNVLLYGVSFGDANHGTAVGELGTVLRTTDGGITWTPQESGTKVSLNGIAFTDANHGTAVGARGTLLRTTNGGETWTAESVGTSDDLNGVFLLSDGTGISAGDRGTILRTTDGGASWTPRPSGTSSYLLGVSLDGRFGVIVGEAGTVLSTNDAGATWGRAPSSGPNVDLSSVCPGFAVGDATTVLENRGVRGWVQQIFRLPAFYGVSFVNSRTGTVVGERGLILRTTDGGENWTTQSSGTTRRLTAVFFTDANTGTSVGDSGTILRTTDGGASWTSQISGTRAQLWSVSFVSTSLGIVVGSTVILRTTDGGDTWMVQSNATALSSVSFVNPKVAVAVGSGAVLRTEDGGATWQQAINFKCQGHFPPARVCTYLNGVSFIDGNTGWVAGADSGQVLDFSFSHGFISRTDDGGFTWRSQFGGRLQNYASLNAVSFLDANIGCAVGYEWGDGPTPNMGSGVIVRTTDGGETWQKQTVGPVNLRALSFVDENTGLVAGSALTIFSTTTLLEP